MKNKVLLLLSLLLAACSHDDDTIVYRSRYHWVERTVAVVAPIDDDATWQRLKRTAEWFLDNFNEAQLHDSLCVRLNIEWHDETTEDLETLSKKMAQRDDIMAVIGPFGNDNVATFAAACQRTRKTMIAPTATSEDVIRRFAVGTAGVKNKSPFLWSLTETDVTLSEVMMSSYATFIKLQTSDLEDTEAALFAPDDSYGRTFTDWAPFQAENMDISLVLNETYDDSHDLQRQLTRFLGQQRKMQMLTTASFCILEDAQQLADIARTRRQWIIDNILKSQAPSQDANAEENDTYWAQFEEMYRSWMVYNDISEERIAALGDRGKAMIEGYQGFSPYADPTTGFELSYKKRYGTPPTFAECKFYDALMLASFAAFYQEHTATEEARSTLNDAIIAITNDVNEETTMGGSAWAPTAMAIYLKAMVAGQLMKFRGASGNITFDSDTYTAATHTTYVHWKIMDGKVEHMNYFSSDGSRRVSQSTAAWRWAYDEAVALSELIAQTGQPSAAISYPPLGEQYAVLVQGSSGFQNYRHQADVLNMYQLLRRGGYDDDHIILIIDQAMANSADNTEKGIVRNAIGGPDLLGGTTEGVPPATVDYDNAQLSAQDISDILTGIRSDRLPTVLPTDAANTVPTNVLFYWSGHGRNMSDGGCNEFKWRNEPAGNGFTKEMMLLTAALMTQQQCRKLLVVAEPCYSEVVISGVSGIKGVLALAGAGADEQSFADHWNGDLGPRGSWMCDRFSTNLTDYIAANPTTTYRDLYLYCVQHTLGSHVKVVNAANFGNLYMTGPQEFFYYMK